jgi:hypothetical protein
VVWIGLVILVVVLFTAGIIVPLYLDGGGGASRLLAPSAIVGAVGSVIALGGLARAIKTDRFYSRWNSVSSPLSASDLKAARMQLAGKHEATADRAPVLRAMAEQERRNTQSGLLIFSGVVLLTVSQVLTAANGFRLFFYTAIVVLIIVMMVREVFRFRSNGRFLAAHQG